MTAEERHISAAQGYVELALYEDALREIDALSHEAHMRPDTVETRLLCYLHYRDWEQALTLALLLCELTPEDACGYVHAAYCLHEQCRTEEAVEMLESGPPGLREKAIFYYNMACYHTQLGSLGKAKVLLERSFELDTNLRRSAQRDPDLKPLLYPSV
jgi:tetratricopeptide (TPR) repeat protein